MSTLSIPPSMISFYAKTSGAYEVWSTWYKTKIKQGRTVDKRQESWSTLSKQDKVMDGAIAEAVISDFLFYISNHDIDGEHIQGRVVVEIDNGAND